MTNNTGFPKWWHFMMLAVLLLALPACGGPGPVRRPAVYERMDGASTRGLRQLERGDVGGARKNFDEALRLARSVDDSESAAIALINRVRTDREEGVDEGTAGRIREALDLVSPDGRVFPEAALEAARLELREGRNEKALNWAERSSRASVPESPTAIAAMSLQALALLRRGREPEARQVVYRSIEAARRTENRRALGNGLRVLAEVEAAAGNDSAVRAACEEALGEDRLAGRSRGVALDLFCLASEAAERGDPEAAADYFRRAASVVSHSGGMKDLAEILRLRSRDEE